MRDFISLEFVVESLSPHLSAAFNRISSLPNWSQSQKRVSAAAASRKQLLGRPHPPLVMAVVACQLLWASDKKKIKNSTLYFDCADGFSFPQAALVLSENVCAAECPQRVRRSGVYKVTAGQRRGQAQAHARTRMSNVLCDPPGSESAARHGFTRDVSAPSGFEVSLVTAAYMISVVVTTGEYRDQTKTLYSDEK